MVTAETMRAKIRKSPIYAVSRRSGEMGEAGRLTVNMW
jgi:hypothetical protein